MTADPSVYNCPTCGKPFDRKDGLVNFAIASHEKDHRADRNSPANMIRYDEDGLMWVCKLCGDPMHNGEYSARVAIVTHAREKHGQTFGSSAPVTARGGSSGGRRSGLGRVADAVEDAVEAVLDGVGNALGKLMDP